MFKNIFKKTKYATLVISKNEGMDKRINEKDDNKKPYIPDGMWIKCPKCNQILYKKDIAEKGMICPTAVIILG